MTIYVDRSVIGRQPDGKTLSYYVGRCTDCPGESAMRFSRRDILAWGTDHEALAHPGRDGAARRRRREH